MPHEVLIRVSPEDLRKIAPDTADSVLVKDEAYGDEFLVAQARLTFDGEGQLVLQVADATA